MRKGTLACVAALLGWALSAAALPGPDLGLLQEQNRIKTTSEEKIQKDVLDPILGKGMAMVFVDVEMELKLEREESTRSGMGLAEKYREKLGAAKRAAAQTEFALPGIPRPRTITAGGNDRPETAQAQQATQVKGIQEERFAAKPVFKRLGVTVSHDERVLKDKAQVDLVRSRIVDAMVQYQLSPDQVAFRPTPFHKEGDKIKDWKDDLQRPEVYLPLLFAGLLLLFLWWLFGPLLKFLKQYLEALKEKPAAEVNVDSTIEPPEDQGNKGPLTSEGKLDINLTKKPDESPPPPSEEDEAMKKFEPFSYINEENIKRLVYMFILRKEEPWIIATVVSYLRPDYQRMILTSLPVDMQAKLALEALTVRQVTREQVMAIDADIKENVDFVVGGMERLTAMLDEADTATRNNILNYLKNEKPLVYEKVRKHLITFEDVVSFPEREMQVLVRELKTENMAKALQDAPPEVVNKFLTNMSPGAAALLRESMEYSQGLTPAQIEEERAQIVDLIKVMEKEGKISIRAKAQEGVDLIEGMQEELGAQERRQQRFAAARRKAEPASPAAPPAAAPAPAVAVPAAAADPAQAQGYFDAAVAYYNAGQAEQSVQYFEYALTLNPALWQAHQYLGGILHSLGRTSEALAHYEKLLALNPNPEIKAWVESFKTQVG